MLTLKRPVHTIANHIGTTPWIARHGLSSAAYQAEFDKLHKKGFRLIQVSGYTVNGQPRFAAIWEQTDGPIMLARHNLSSTQYQNEFDKLTRKGYRLTCVSGYENNGQANFAAIWEKKSGPSWAARHNLTADEYQNEFDAFNKKGYRLVLVEGYGVGKQALYAAVWEKRSGPAGVARHGLTAEQYQDEFDKLVDKGYRLVHVSGYSVGHKDLYAAIWEKKAGPAWQARHRLSSKGYQAEFIDLLLQGHRLKLVSGYPLLRSARYAAIWEAEPHAVDGSFCANGQCFDLQRFADEIEAKLQGINVAKYGFEVRRGLEVIQRADGPARTAADPPPREFTVFDRFNPASVSKTVTAVATLQILARKRISINALIHPHLPPTWDIPSSVKTITFKEVLNHTSGFRGGWGGYEYKHMEKMVEGGVDLNDKVKHYHNVNYALLRILVASLDGYKQWIVSPGKGTAARFIAYVNKRVFAPLGIFNVAYKAVDNLPTLFYPAPPGAANGTSYGDWSLKPGSAGSHLSVHELAIFVAALFHGLLLTDQSLSAAKDHGLGFGDYGVMPDGSQAWGKGGFFPGENNGGAELNSVVIHFDSGVSTMLAVNGSVNVKSLVLNAYEDALVPQ